MASSTQGIHLKRNGKKRPLGLPVWSDKLLAEVIRLILNAYYDVQSIDHSHGFREDKEYATRPSGDLSHLGGVTWIIEGDISDCSAPYRTLIVSTLGEKIPDGRFLHLNEELLDAGYLEDWKFHQTLSGVPRLNRESSSRNILLDSSTGTSKRFSFLQYTLGEKRTLNQEYVKLHNQMLNC